MKSRIKPCCLASALALPSLLAMLFSGCHPYYNTFYNAEEAYQIAWRDHRKIMRVFPDSLAVAPTERSVAKYDRAVEKSLKMMEVYPRDTKRHDRAHFLMGRAAFYKKDFPVAVGRMRDLQALYPESKLVPASQVYVATSHIMMDNLAIAEEILLELMQSHPELDRQQEITMLLVEIAMRRSGRSQALGLLEGINGRSLPIEKRLDILLRMADLNYELRQYEKSLNLLRHAPRSRKHPYLMFRVDRSIYFCLDATDALEAALSHLSAMKRNRMYADQRYEIAFYTAMTLRRMGRIDEAVALLGEIKAMCAKSAGGEKPDTVSLCGRAYYELALIYRELGGHDMAEAALEEAAKYTGTPTGSKASARLAALRRLRELRTPDSLGRVSAEARYSAAELFRFELSAPDSAYAYYLELAADTSADSAVRPRALLAAAVVGRYELSDAARADSLFKVVIGEYGGTEYARLAQIELDIEVTVVTRRETAERDFRAAEALMEGDMVEAVKAFYAVYQQYGDLEIAPKSLHAAAWYTDNALQRNTAALALYEELCKEYPRSVYCKKSASPRVAVAKDSIEARRKRRAEEGGAAGAAADSAAVGLEDGDAGGGKAKGAGGNNKEKEQGKNQGAGADKGGGR